MDQTNEISHFLVVSPWAYFCFFLYFCLSVLDLKLVSNLWLLSRLFYPALSLFQFFWGTIADSRHSGALSAHLGARLSASLMIQRVNCSPINARFCVTAGQIWSRRSNWRKVVRNITLGFLFSRFAGLSVPPPRVQEIQRWILHEHVGVLPSMSSTHLDSWLFSWFKSDILSILLRFDKITSFAS